MSMSTEKSPPPIQSFMRPDDWEEKMIDKMMTVNVKGRISDFVWSDLLDIFLKKYRTATVPNMSDRYIGNSIKSPIAM